MNIAHILLNLNCGGLERLVVEMAESLNRRGENALIITLERDGDFLDEARKKGITVVTFEKAGGLDLSLVLKLRRVLKENRVDIVHTHNFAPLIYGTLAAALSGIPCVNTRHGRADKRAHALFWRLNRHIVAVSRDARNEMLKCNRIPREKVKVIYNGIPVDAFAHPEEGTAPRLKKEWGIGPDDLVIGHVGRLSEEKDQAALIRAARELSAKGLKATLVIAGDGPLRGALERMAQEYGIDPRVKFLGYRDDIAKVMAGFDVFVLCSLMEGVSLTLLEAMAAGKPVIATDVGGNPEVVADGETGILVPCRAPEAISKAVERLINDPASAARMGAAGEKRVREVFDIEKMVEAYVALYQGMPCP